MPRSVGTDPPTFGPNPLLGLSDYDVGVERG